MTAEQSRHDAIYSEEGQNRTSLSSEEVVDRKYAIRIKKKPELTAIVRSLGEFKVFDTKLREEILTNATASVEEEVAVFLPALPGQKKGERDSSSFPQELQEFLDAVFRIPSAVHSEALASFLALPESLKIPTGSSLQQHHMYLDYLLPSSNGDEANHKHEYQMIPRLGKFTHCVDTLLPGWWVVWKFHIESDNHALEFSLYIDQVLKADDSDALNKSRDASLCSEKEFASADVSVDVPVDSSPSASYQEATSTRELAHREVCSVSSGEPICGSYRFPPNVSVSAKATFEFASVGKMSLLRGGRVRLESAAIPHEAFRAACEAAQDQNDADARRMRSPILYAILDSPQNEKEVGDMHLTVESATERNTRFNRSDSSPNHVSEVKTEAYTAPQQKAEGGEPTKMGEKSEKNDEVKRLKGEVENLHKDRDSIRNELGRITKLADDGKRTLQLMLSEKRIWSVAREEIQGELSRLSNDFSAEYQEKKELKKELETAKQEVQRLRGEMEELEIRLPSEEETRLEKETLETAQCNLSEKDAKIVILEEGLAIRDEELEYWKAKNTDLEAESEKRNATMKENTTEARVEVDEARMLQRILEGKVRHLERELSRAREGSTPRGKGSAPRRALDPKVDSFQHVDERLNKQLNSLRDRHSQLASLLCQNPNSPKNMELIGKIEKAIHDIVSSGV